MSGAVAGGLLRTPETMPAAPLRGQLLQQGLGLLQVERVEAFGEPAVYWREKIARFGPPALLAPQTGEAHRGAQLIGLRLLPARDTDRLFESVLALIKPVEAGQRDAFQAMKIRIPLTMARLLLGTQPVSRRYKSPPLFALTYQRIGQPGQAVASQPRRAGPAGKPLAQTNDS